MATTKIIPGVLDLNESTSESGLKIPTGTNNNRPATDVAGMVRNNTNETSDGSASCEEYYNGTAWKRLNNIPFPVYFKTVTYTGDGSSNRAITGLGFKPDLVWIKNRSVSKDHMIFDSTRGTTNPPGLYPNLNLAEFSGDANNFVSFDADGFTVGSGTYTNANEMVAWCWKANGGTTSSNTDGNVTSTVQTEATAGFSIVQFTTPGSPGASTTVGHGLGSTPDMILLKRTDGTEDWLMYHTSMGLNKFMKLNDTAAQGTATNLYGVVNSTVFCPSFTLTGNMACIAYCFKNIAGYSKFGSYIGDATAGQAITDVGFELTWVLIKSTVGTANWLLYDTTRGITSGGFLNPDNTDAETADSLSPNITVTATGFTITSGGVTQGLNSNGNLYIYAAFK